MAVRSGADHDGALRAEALGDVEDRLARHDFDDVRVEIGPLGDDLVHRRMADGPVPTIEQIHAVGPGGRLFNGYEGAFLPGQDLVVNRAGVEAVLGVARQIADAQEAKDLLNGEDREVVDLPRSVEEDPPALLAVLEDQVGEALDRLLVGQVAPLARGPVLLGGLNADRVGGRLPHRRHVELDAAGGRPLLGDVEASDLGLGGGRVALEALHHEAGAHPGAQRRQAVPGVLHALAADAERAADRPAHADELHRAEEVQPTFAVQSRRQLVDAPAEDHRERALARGRQVAVGDTFPPEDAAVAHTAVAARHGAAPV